MESVDAAAHAKGAGVWQGGGGSAKKGSGSDQYAPNSAVANRRFEPSCGPRGRAMLLPHDGAGRTRKRERKCLTAVETRSFL